MAEKSNLLYNRWLSAKGLSLWVNQSDHAQAFELLTEAESLAPNNPGEALRNLAVKHYVARESATGDIASIKSTLEQMAKESDEGATIWQNVQSTGHFCRLHKTRKKISPIQDLMKSPFEPLGKLRQLSLTLRILAHTHYAYGY